MKLRGWKEIVEYTGICRKTILKLAKEDQKPFPIVKIAGQYMTTREKIDEWVNSKIANS